MVCTPWAAVLGSRTRVDPYNRSITKPLTGEPDAGDPPVRFGGRGKVQSLVPTPIDPELDAALPRWGAHLDTTAGRCGPKSETRNSKPETNSNAQWSKAQNRQQGSGFGHSLLGAWGLFRASSFGFRVSALWMAVVPRCTSRPTRVLESRSEEPRA